MRLPALLAVAVAAFALTPVAAARGDASLRLLRVAPVQVVAAGFEPGERVVVTLAVGRTRSSRGLVADGSGAFRVTFRTLVATDPCRGSVVVTARGAAGSRASVARQCRPPYPALP